MSSAGAERDGDDLVLRVASIERLSADVVVIELRGTESQCLPPFTAGAHIVLSLPNGLLRSYSLINAQEERDRYVVAVGRDARSRGGSTYIHDQVRVGQRLPVLAPRNNFAFVEAAERTLFIAGGIGVTPFLSMIRRAERLERRWELYYCARSRQGAAFLGQLSALASERGRLLTHFDDEFGGQVFDMGPAIASADPATHLYCCGPAPMLATFKELCGGRSAETVHLEYFTPPPAAGEDRGFTVHLQRQGRSIHVPPGVTILEALLAAGIDAPSACREGVCGTCEVRVIDGLPDHRDAVLSPAERQSNRTMMICCSRSLTALLTLDL